MPEIYTAEINEKRYTFWFAFKVLDPACLAAVCYGLGKKSALVSVWRRPGKMKFNCRYGGVTSIMSRGQTVFQSICAIYVKFSKTFNAL